MEKLKDYLRIKQAAEFLGVAQNTLRAWGQTGRIPEQRHPINGYLNTVPVHKQNENSYGMLFVDVPMLSLVRKAGGSERCNAAEATREKINTPFRFDQQPSPEKINAKKHKS